MEELSKSSHDVSDEARDEHGRWTKGSVDYTGRVRERDSRFPVVIGHEERKKIFYQNIKNKAKEKARQEYEAAQQADLKEREDNKAKTALGELKEAAITTAKGVASIYIGKMTSKAAEQWAKSVGEEIGANTGNLVNDMWAAATSDKANSYVFSNLINAGGKFLEGWGVSQLWDAGGNSLTSILKYAGIEDEKAQSYSELVHGTIRRVSLNVN